MLDMSTVGPMGRAVEDVALLLQVIAGPDDVDPFVSAAPVGDPLSVDVASLRVGLYTSLGHAPSTPGTREAIERAGAALAALGARVEEAQPPSLDDAVDLAFAMMAADGGAQARADLAAADGRHVPQVVDLLDDLVPLALSAEGFFALVRRWAAMRSALRRFVSGFDVVLCPVAAGPAPLPGRRPGDGGELTDYGDFGYAFAYAIAGVPGAVVPAGSENGLPVGVQVLAPAFKDARRAGRREGARGHARRRAAAAAVARRRRPDARLGAAAVRARPPPARRAARAGARPRPGARPHPRGRAQLARPAGDRRPVRPGATAAARAGLRRRRGDRRAGRRRPPARGRRPRRRALRPGLAGRRAHVGALADPSRRPPRRRPPGLRALLRRRRRARARRT